MTPAGSSASRDDDDRTIAMPVAVPPAGSPAADLAGVWDLLDALPQSAPSGQAAARLTATTVQMAAGTAGARSPGSAAARRRAWVAPALVVAAALAAGHAAGRLSVPDGEARLAEHLPYVQHLDLLREAGSVRFLESLATRDDPPPFRLLRPPADVAAREESRFRAELAALAAQLGDVEPGTDARRRERVAALTLEERVDLEKAARAFGRLSATERQAIELLAAALADPARPELREAALDWHQWLQVVRPEDRERVVASGTDKRLEWIEWYASRLDGRMRPGFFDRPPGGGPPRGDGGPGFRPFGPPRVRPDEPGPAETPAPPR